MKAGSQCFARIWHLLGRASHPDAPEQIASGQLAYAPSAIPARGGKFRFLPGVPVYVTPTGIDSPMRLVALHKQAAINAKEEGFDGVEGPEKYMEQEAISSPSSSIADQISAQTAEDPLEETLEIYNYFITQVDQLGLAYIAIQRYSEFDDPIIEGKRRAVQHDVVAAYSHLIKKSTFLSNGNFTPEEAAQYVSEGKISGVFWGRLWVSHPDLAKRIRYGKPVDTPVYMQTVYGNMDGMTLNDQRVGYTDYPFAEHPNEA
ncbi:hypothetical protein GG344DRAFT_76598 [Lentinula edodes]|nr:hypothetical protein GG344DRAFT_76598 [Lentinula edodes]